MTHDEVISNCYNTVASFSDAEVLSYLSIRGYDTKVPAEVTQKDGGTYLQWIEDKRDFMTNLFYNEIMDMDHS